MFPSPYSREPGQQQACPQHEADGGPAAVPTASEQQHAAAATTSVSASPGNYLKTLFVTHL